MSNGLRAGKTPRGTEEEVNSLTSDRQMKGENSFTLRGRSVPRRRDLVNDLLGEKGELGDPSVRPRDADGMRAGVEDTIRLILDARGSDMFTEYFS